MTSRSIAEAIEALPPALLEALGMVAVNQDGWVAKGKIKALEKRGLVESYQDQIAGSPNAKNVIDRLPINVTRYYVPLPVHIAWCAWCSTHVSDDD